MKCWYQQLSGIAKIAPAFHSKVTRAPAWFHTVVEPRRYDWEVGTLIVPPNMWFHQHFNSGNAPARYLAFKHEVVSIRNAQGVPKAWISRRVGGDQVDYIDEKPEIRRIFAAELADLPPKQPQSEAAE